MNESHLTLRRATEQDMMLYFEWANDPVVRQNAFSQEPIPLEAHKSWFAKKLADKNTVMYVLESDGVPAGQIRFDLVEPHLFEIGYTIASEFRGKGLGTVILQTSTQQLERDKALFKPFTMRGVVKQENIPSCKAFLSAGYEEKNNLQPYTTTSLRYFYRNLL